MCNEKVHTVERRYIKNAGCSSLYLYKAVSAFRFWREKRATLASPCCALGPALRPSMLSQPSNPRSSGHVKPVGHGSSVRRGAVFLIGGQLTMTSLDSNLFF